MQVNNRKEYIRTFLKSLTRTERVIVVLYYYEEMTIPEIAKSLDFSPSEVSEMHASVISRCRAYMQEHRSVSDMAIRRRSRSMNRKQLIVMWVGIAVFVCIGLAATTRDPWESLSNRPRDYAPLIVRLASTVVVTTGLIFTLKDRKKKDS